MAKRVRGGAGDGLRGGGGAEEAGAAARWGAAQGGAAAERVTRWCALPDLFV